MARALSREEIRRVDARAVDEYGIPSIVLMENAGRGLTEVALRELARLRAPADAAVAIVCGRGNNGGDGFVLARHLANAGRRPTLLLHAKAADGATCAFATTADAATNLAICEAMGIAMRRCSSGAELTAALDELAPALVVDALLGTGLSAPLRDDAVSLIEAINAAGLPCLAVDIPSGLDADTGRPLGAAVRAARTATMAALKRGFEAPGAAAWTGAIELVDIGCPRALLEGS